jgi:hypothetical protein
MCKCTNIQSILTIRELLLVSWPGLSWPSMGDLSRPFVDARIKSGHDGIGDCEAYA